MRQIGHLEDEASARLFGDFLYVQGVENQIEPEAGHGWGIWIHAEEDLERANRLLGEFYADPAHPRFRAQAQSADELRAQARAEQAAYRNKVINGRQMFARLYGYGLGPLTLLLIIASVVVFVLSKFGNETERVMSLYITEWREAGRYIEWGSGLPEVRHGQVWRLFTPMFIHYTFLHIFFNMLWLRDLGSMIEGRQGTWFLALQVLVLAGVSNAAQFFIGGPVFGGMSGVVYGLFGYVWMQGRFNPGSGLVLHPSTVMMMLIWFVLCFLGLIGHVANYAHAGGLLAGVAWGFLAARRGR